MDRPICSLPGCKEPVRVLKSGDYSDYCCRLHGKLYYERSLEGVALKKKRRLKKAYRVEGRKCGSCFVTDKEISRWGTSPNLCEACARLGVRNGFCSCGRVKRKFRVGRLVYSDALCVLCDEAVLETLGYTKTVLLHPTTDDERIIWRKGFRVMAEVVTVTINNWCSLR